jgi:hypothetical protein
MDLTRRTLLKGTLGGLAGLATSGAIVPSALRQLLASPGTRDGRSLIILWMAGGPSTIDLWDPKPGRPNGGRFDAIDTDVASVQFSEVLPRCAKRMRDLTVIRSMKTNEAAHERGHYLLHTGYGPNPTVRHPALGAICAAEIGDPNLDLPSYVSIGGTAPGAGLLGVGHDPLLVQNPRDPLAFIREANGVDPARGEARAKLLLEGEEAYRAKDDEAARARRETLSRSRRLMRSPLLQAFDLSKESQALRSEYGGTPFGDSCLLARRLVETGVACVEVVLGGWDTHRKNFEAVRKLSGSLDPAMAGLVKVLKDRGRLEKTLVLWMGEFGRTPRVNEFDGRDHYARAWSVVMAGGGLEGGKVVGGTDEDGEEVVSRPVSAQDLLATVCTSLGVDAAKENISPEGRPIKIVNGGTPLLDLFARPEQPGRAKKDEAIY